MNAIGLGLLVVAVFLLTAKFRCRGITTKKKPCTKRRRGLFHDCPDHGRWARLAYFAGSMKLYKRANCECGRHRVLRRNRATGELFLGCSGFSAGCKLTMKL